MTYNKIPNILELNNIDILGRRFNGYDLFNHFKRECDNFNINMLVNNRLSHKSTAKPLFRSGYTEECDWIVQAAEKKYLGTKNQLSLAEEAIIENPLFRKSDILHFHLYHNMNLPIEFLTRIPSSKKIIIDIHDTFWLTDKHIPMLEVFSYTNANAKSLSQQRKRVLHNIDAHFVVHSQYILNLFKKSSITKDLKNVHFVNFGIDFSIFKPIPKKQISEIRNRLDIPKNNIVLLCRAQKEFKGLDYVIQALKLLKTKKPISIITVTNTNMLDELKDTYQVIDAGTIFKEQKMAELYNACDIFLSPSTEESFGFMAVEAMACGKPVIVFKGTALPTTTNAPKIGIATERNAESLKNAIEKLINNPNECLRRGKMGIKFARDNYNKTNYYKEYAKLFKQINKTSRKPTLAQCNNKKAPDASHLEKQLSMAKKEILEQRNYPIKDRSCPIVDYNDPSVQQIIKNFNQEIYHYIKHHHKNRHIIYTYKRNAPEPVKKALSISRRIIVALPRKTIKLIKRIK